MLKQLAKFSKQFIWLLAGIVIFWMLVVAGNCSARMDRNEHTYLISDSLFGNIISSLVAFLVVFVVFHFVTEYKSHRESNLFKYYQLTQRIVWVIIGFFGIMFVFGALKAPAFDQAYVLECAKSFKQNDFKWLNTGEYLDFYQNQYGIVLFFYYLSFVFGSYNYLAIQLINVCALVITYVSLCKIIERKLGSSYSELFLFMIIVFIPPILYVTFVYGTIIGLMFCALGVLFYLKFDESGLWRFAVLSFVSNTLAVCIKQNYLIFVLGLIIYIGIEFLERQEIKLLIAIAMIGLSLVVSATLPASIVKSLSGREITGGIPSVAWVAMGLQDNAGLYDGWWNNYNISVYTESDCDPELAAVKSKDVINERLDYFRSHPDIAISFFSRKNASQWLNPDFQGFWINWKMAYVDFRTVNAGWVEELLSTHGNESVFVVLNFLQFQILLGVFLYVLSKKKDNLCVYFVVVFLGGIIFHTFWEAKAQYALPFFMYLIPVSASGWMNAFNKTNCLYSSVRQRAQTSDCLSFVLKSERNTIALSIMLLVGVILIQSGQIGILNQLFIVNPMDDAEYQNYYDSTTSVRFNNSKYRLCSALDDTLLIGYDNSEGIKLVKQESDSYSNVTIKSYGDKSELYFRDCDKYLYIPNSDANEGVFVQLSQEGNTTAQSWKIQKKPDDSYQIFFGDTEYVLTADIDGNSVYLSATSESENQKWLIK